MGGLYLEKVIFQDLPQISAFGFNQQPIKPTSKTLSSNSDCFIY